MNERRRQAYLMNTTPEFVTRHVDAMGQEFWHNLEYEIGSNYEFGNNIVHPIAFVDRVQAIQDPQYPIELTMEQIGPVYIYNNSVVQQFLLQFYKDSIESAIWNLNNVLNGTLDTDTQKLLGNLWTTLRECIQKYGYPRGAEECYKTNLDPLKQKFRAEYEKERALEEQLERLAVPYDEFKLESLQITFKVSTDATNRFRSLMHWFDMCTLSPEVPLIVMHDIHKVLKGYSYALDSIPRYSNTMQLHLKGYTTRVSVRWKDGFWLSFKSKSKPNQSMDADDSKILELACKALGIAENELERYAQGLNGRVLVPNVQAFSVDLWRDLVMNDERAFTFFAIDETRLTKHVQESAPLDEEPEALEQSESASLALPHIFLANGVAFEMLVQLDQLTLVYTNLSSLQHAEEISKRMAQMIGLYANARRTILEQYRQLTNDVTLVPTARLLKPPKKKKKKPEIYSTFGANYSRAVGRENVPSMVSEDQVRDIENAGFQVMQFPKSVDLAPGEEPMYFACHERSDDHVYPGLLLNPYPGGKYPLLPRCYKEDQRLKTSSDTYEYFSSETTFDDFRFRQKDRSFVDVDQTKPCPELIDNLYFLNGFVAPVRWGVHRTPLSALECILYALNIRSFRTLAREQRLSLLEQEFQNLPNAFPHYLSLCAQEAWDLAYPQITPNTVYFDLRIWVRLVEEAYNCTIVMLSVSDFIFPHHIQGRWLWERDPERPVIVLYEHYGATSVARASYPQCEWITFAQNLDPKAIEHRFVDQYALEASGWRALTINKLQFADAFNQANLSIQSQHIDFYGKVYALNVQSSGTMLTLFLRHLRIPPLNIPRAQSAEVFFGSLAPFSTGEFGDHQYIRLGEFEFFVYKEPHSESARETYDFMRSQVRVLTENAKRIYAQNLESERSNDWSFIQVNLERAYRPLNRYYFDSSGTVFVPNEQTKQRLKYALQLYARRNATELMQYLDLSILPFEYDSLADFQVQPNAVVMTNDRVIRWNEALYNPIELTGMEKPIPAPFVTWIDRRLYRCHLLDVFPQWVQYKLFFPQTRQCFVVGGTPLDDADRIVIATKQPDNATLTFYRCIPSGLHRSFD